MTIIKRLIAWLGQSDRPMRLGFITLCELSYNDWPVSVKASAR